MTDILMQSFWQSVHIQRSQHHRAKRPSFDIDKVQVAFLSSGFLRFSHLIQKVSRKPADYYQLHFLKTSLSFTEI